MPEHRVLHHLGLAAHDYNAAIRRYPAYDNTVLPSSISPMATSSSISAPAPARSLPRFLPAVAVAVTVFVAGWAQRSAAERTALWKLQMKGRPRRYSSTTARVSNPTKKTRAATIAIPELLCCTDADHAGRLREGKVCSGL